MCAASSPIKSSKIKHKSKKYVTKRIKNNLQAKARNIAEHSIKQVTEIH